jgi:hypothetical protein
MSKPFDATLKELIRAYPADWLTHLGVAVTAEVLEIIPADLSSLSTPEWRDLHLRRQQRPGAQDRAGMRLLWQKTTGVFEG